MKTKNKTEVETQRSNMNSQTGVLHKELCVQSLLDVLNYRKENLYIHVYLQGCTKLNVCN